MLPEAELRRVLPALPTHQVHGPWYRAVDFAALQGPPLNAPSGTPIQPLWPGGPRQRGARFTPKNSFDAIYVASDAQTAFAETNRVFLVPGGPTFPLKSVPTVTLTIDGFVADVLDLTDETIQRQLATSTAELTGDWRYTQSLGKVPPTQLLAQAAYDTTAIHALLCISAKNPVGGTTMVVFTDRFGCGQSCYLEVYDPSGHLYQRLA
jgi:RES domain-containing protein